MSSDQDSAVRLRAGLPRLLKKALTPLVWVVVVCAVAIAVAFCLDGEPDSTGSVDKLQHPAQLSKDDLGSQIWHVAFSPDGSLLASTTIDGDLKVRQIATGNSSLMHSGKVGSIRDVAFSSDSRTMAVSSSTKGSHLLKLKSAAAAESWLPTVGVDSSRCVTFAADGRRLVVGFASGSVGIFDSEDPQQPPLWLAGLDSALNTLAFSPDGSKLAGGDGSGAIALWQISSRTLLARVKGHDLGVSRLVYSPDGRTLVSCASLEPFIHAWDGETLRPLGRSQADSMGVNSVAFSADGSLFAAAGMDGTVTIRRGPLEPPGVTLRTGRSLYALAFSADGALLATGGRDGILRLWDLPRLLSSAIPASPSPSQVPAGVSPTVRS